MQLSGGHNRGFAPPIASLRNTSLGPCPHWICPPFKTLHYRQSRLVVNRTQRRLICVAHGDHSGGHGGAAAKAIVRSLDSQDEDHHVDPGCCGHHGHDHHGHNAPKNAVYNLLTALYRITGASKVASYLEHSLVSNLIKVGLFAVAAATFWRASVTTNPATQALLRQVYVLATSGVYFFAGLPAAIDLSLDLAALQVDTHVLMNLAVIGALVTGHPLEGALLLVLFQGSHAVEHLLTARAQGSLQALYDAVPDTADVVSLQPDGAPDLRSARRVPVADVQIGDMVLVKPGGQVPLDGCIVHGRALVSAELISGEALPSLRRDGDDIPAGALCHDGVLTVKVELPAADSTPARIARLAREAQARRPRLRTWLDSFGEIYSKAVIVAAMAALVAMLAAGVPLLNVAGVERGALYRAMGLLTVASPCALVMVPLAYVSAIAAAASRGIILKGGRVLDALDACKIVALDKTGTVTTGTLRMADIVRLEPGGDRAPRIARESADSSPSGSTRRGLAIIAAAALSLRSTHPVSDAMARYATRCGVDAGAAHVADFVLVPGGGACGLVVAKQETNESIDHDNGSNSQHGGGPISSQQNNQHQEGGQEAEGAPYMAYFGSLDFVSERLSLEENAVVRQFSASAGAGSIFSVLVLEPTSASTISSAQASTPKESTSTQFEAPEASSLGFRQVSIFAFEDTVRTRSLSAIQSLQSGSWATERPVKRRACRVLMLTGDNEASARKVATQLGIQEVHAGLAPEEKQRRVAKLQEEDGGASARRGVIMVGDGLNDAAALAAADVGVAVASSGAATTSIAADAVVLGDAAGASALPLLLRLARAARHVIRQNLVLAAGSIVVLALPVVLGVVPLWVAVMLHEGSTLLVALNSLRLLRFSATAVKAASVGRRQRGRNVGAGDDEKKKDSLLPGGTPQTQPQLS